ncbi:MAG: TlyA family RNA methyltransferase [Lautropia sp.]
MRADVALVERGLARSRALAQRLIGAGAVERCDGTGATPVRRAAEPVSAADRLTVRASPEARFASRGGAKLDAALNRAGIACRGEIALDVGQSTGGFTDCLLTRGAARVIGIEVGHGQLAAALAADPRVACLERTHLHDVDREQVCTHGAPAAGSRLIVVDLSFISTIAALPRLAALAAPAARLVALIKPQFELGPDARDRRGIVPAQVLQVELAGLRQRAHDAAVAAGWRPDDWFACALPGGDGNQEYFLIGTRVNSPWAFGPPGAPPAAGQSPLRGDCLALPASCEDRATRQDGKTE